MEFRKTITKISNEIQKVEDIDSFIHSLWSNELLTDMERLAPKSRTKFVLNTILDMGLSIPVTGSPGISLLQLLGAAVKLAYDTDKEYKDRKQHQKSLTHFCSELRKA